MPWSGSPGCATIGWMVDRSIACTPPAYSAPGSGATTRARSASRSAPGRMRGDPFERLLVRFDDGGAWPSIRWPCWPAWPARRGDSARRPGPANSMIRSSVSCGLAWCSRMYSITSLAVTFGRSAPVSSKRIDSEHFDGGEAGVHEVRVLGGADAPGEGVVHAAHAGVAVGGLDEVARVDEVSRARPRGRCRARRCLWPRSRGRRCGAGSRAACRAGSGSCR